MCSKIIFESSQIYELARLIITLARSFCAVHVKYFKCLLCAPADYNQTPRELHVANQSPGRETMSTYKLFYFNARGSAEPIRIIFAQAGIIV